MKSWQSEVLRQNECAPPPTLVTADTPDWPPFHPQTGGTLIDVGRNRCSPERFGGRKVVGARSSIEVLRERTPAFANGACLSFGALTSVR